MAEAESRNRCSSCPSYSHRSAGTLQVFQIYGGCTCKWTEEANSGVLSTFVKYVLRVGLGVGQGAVKGAKIKRGDHVLSSERIKF